LPERLIDSVHRDKTVGENDARRELLRQSATSLGIGTVRDLADYYRMSTRDAGPRIAELVEEGVLTPVGVEGWKEQAYLSQEARFPRDIVGASLLSPFDPLVWFRPRAERLFDFEYRIEIYVPEAKRRWGYYVLPFRLGDRIVARVDLKADRPARTLLVRSLHHERGTDEKETEFALQSELGALAAWLGLESVAYC
jgi:uncharacterized protein YcaQ